MRGWVRLVLGRPKKPVVPAEPPGLLLVDFAGTPELRAAGFRLGIVTSNTESTGRMFLRKFDLDFIAFIRSSSKLLGKAHEIRGVIKTEKTPAEEILFLGDGRDAAGNLSSQRQFR